MGTWGAPVSRSSTLTFQPAENRLAEGVVHIPDSARLGLEIAPQEVTQRSVRRNETLPIALESETCTPVRARQKIRCAFWRERRAGRCKAPRRRRCGGIVEERQRRRCPPAAAPFGLRPAGPLAVLLAPYIPQRSQRV